MAKPTFFWKPTCTTCRNARSFLASTDVEVEERDINGIRPTARFSRSNRRRAVPRFREHPQPGVQAAAAAALEEGSDRLMMEQPNLIKRPILVRGAKVTFGFDKAVRA